MIHPQVRDAIRVLKECNSADLLAELGPADIDGHVDSVLVTYIGKARQWRRFLRRVADDTMMEVESFDSRTRSAVLV